MRGHAKFKKLFTEDTQQPESPKRGRNADLICKRNMLLLYRYYYYARVGKMRYEDIIERLVEEFYLASATVVRLITFDEADKLNTIKDEAPGVKTLERIYPHMNWKNFQ